MRRTILVTAAAVWLATAPVALGAWLHFHSGTEWNIGTSSCDAAWQHGLNTAYDAHANVAEQALSCTTVQSRVVWQWGGSWILTVGPVDPAYSGISRSGVGGIDYQSVCGNSQCVSKN